jgi:hypothetical protein
VIKIDERVRRPKFLLEFLARDHLAGMLHQHRQHLKRLLLKPHAQPMFAQFARAQIELEYSEAEPSARLVTFFHHKVSTRASGSVAPGPLRPK